MICGHQAFQKEYVPSSSSVRPSICVPGGPRGEARRRVNTQNEKEWKMEVKQAKKEEDEGSVCVCVKA